MYNSTLRAGLCALLLTTAAAPAVQADTPQGEYAIDGAGLALCPAFKEARASKPEAYGRFIGWLEGYLTAANRFTPGTYDLTPWHTADVLGLVVDGHCDKNPNDRLFVIAQKLVASLMPDRLQQRSELLRLKARDAKGAERTVAIYSDVLRRAQDALAKQKLYQGPVDGQYNQDVQRSFANFQAAVGIDDTGLPDPLTLWLLFSPAQSVAANSPAR